MEEALPKCDVQYSPLLKCGETACFTYNGKHTCLYHMYQCRRSDDCSICLEDMCTDNQSLFILSCGHMFHTDCLSKALSPCCPLCRKQFTPTEASHVFYNKVIGPLSNRLYELPIESVKYCLLAFDIVLCIAKHCQDGAWFVWFKLCMLMGRIGL